MTDSYDETKTPRRAGRGASQDSACYRNHSDEEKVTTERTTDQVVERLRKNVPAELQERSQWVVWKRIVRDRAKKPTKVPFNARTNKRASTTNSESWSSFETALEAYRHGEFDGVGFVFTEDDPFVGIDFDHVRTEDGWDQDVLEDIYAISGYTETSPGGDGVHIIARAEIDLKSNRRGFGEGSGFEAYTKGRYFTMTGEAWDDVHAKTIPDATRAVEACVAKYLGGSSTANPVGLPESEVQGGLGSGKEAIPNPKPTPSSAGTGSGLSEEGINEILTRARGARNGAKFTQLFDEGDLSGHQGDHSAADLALCGLLAYWTNGNAGWIDQLFRLSKLMRSKWDTRRGSETYGQRTIKTAMSGAGNVPGGSRSDHGGRRDQQLAKKRNDGSGKGDANTPAMESAQPQRFRCTDLGNAERFSRDHGRDVRFVHSWGQWLAWDGKRWKKDTTAEIVCRAKKTIRRIHAEASAVDDDAVRSEIVAWAKKSEAKERVKAMIELAKAESGIAITHEALDGDPFLFNCQNGTLDLKTGQLREHRREDLITKLSRVEFQPNASCPMWLRFLDRIMGGDTDLIAFLRRFSGYSLTGDTSEQCLASLYGFGANGKSTFIECLVAVFGDYFQRAPTSLILKRPDGTDGIPNDIARLPGARMVVTSEVEEGSRMAESRIKDLTGGDRLTARFLRQEYFEFAPTHKLWIVGNHRIHIAGTDLGIWRRIMQIPFEVTIPERERDPHLKEKLIARELPGILAWCVAGCLEWRQFGLNPPGRVTEATEEYRAEMDTVGQFVEECCLLNPSSIIGKSELYQAYRNWAEQCGLHALSINRFGRRLKEKGFCDDRSGGSRVWMGVALQRLWRI